MKTKRILSAVLAGMLAAGTAFAFSLRGPTDTWQTAIIGYGVGADDFGGPMNLGEEYRMNVPILTYGFDSTFLNYFGSNGIAAVDAAFKILNDIPHVSQMSASLGEFTRNSKDVNFTAKSLEIQDIKSTVMGIMVAQMGLADPERFVWTLRARQVSGAAPATTNYLVIKRNFDPITQLPSSYVNDVLYTYRIRDPVFPAGIAYADAIEEAPPQSESPFSSVASVDRGVGASPASSSAGLGAGEFFSGLTRDDIGGLRYLLRFDNRNVETLSAGVTLVPQPTNGVFGPGGSFGSSLFGPGGVQFSSPWGPSGTNSFTNNVGGTNAIVVTALRPGIGKVSFTKVLFDSLLYSSLNVTSLFTDTVITNSISINQAVQRVLTVPDILFTAADLPVVPNPVTGQLVPTLYTRTVLGNFQPYAGLNGVGSVLAGPGVIDPGSGAAPAITVTFNKLGLYFTANTPFYITTPGTVWGYFTNSVNIVVFPEGMTLQDLESQRLGR